MKDMRSAGAISHADDVLSRKDDSGEQKSSTKKGCNSCKSHSKMKWRIRAKGRLRKCIGGRWWWFRFKRQNNRLRFILHLICCTAMGIRFDGQNSK
jgi:hypothetical protein